MKQISWILLLGVSLFLCPVSSLAQRSTFVRASLGLGTRAAFGEIESRGAAWMVTGEYGRLAPWLGTGGVLAYARLDYFGESLPTVFIGTSSTVYIDQFLLAFMELEQLPLGGVISPYVNLLIGLNLGAGFQQNQVVSTGDGFSIGAAYFAAGVEIMPIKNLGIHLQVGGPISPFNVGVSARLGQGIKHRSPFGAKSTPEDS